MLLLSWSYLHTLRCLGDELKRRVCMCKFLWHRAPNSYQYLRPAKFHGVWAIVEDFFWDGRRLYTADFLLNMTFISRKKLQILLSTSCGISSRGGRHFDLTYSFGGSLSMGLPATNTFKWASLLELSCDFSNSAALEVNSLVGMNVLETPRVSFATKGTDLFLVRSWHAKLLGLPIILQTFLNVDTSRSGTIQSYHGNPDPCVP